VKMKIFLMTTLLDLTGVGVPEGSVGECNSAHSTWSLLDQEVFGRAHPSFYSGRLVPEGVARSSVLSCYMETFCSMEKLEAGNTMMAGWKC
jgi:hypothetical protein